MSKKSINKNPSELSFIELLVGLFLVYILVNLSQRAIDNFTSNVLGLSLNSAFNAFLIALAVTLIFFLIFSQLSDIENQISQDF